MSAAATALASSSRLASPGLTLPGRFTPLVNEEEASGRRKLMRMFQAGKDDPDLDGRARLPRLASGAAEEVARAATAAYQALPAMGPRWQVARQWAAPGGLVLAGLLLQNLGLYASTRRFVKQMDGHVDHQLGGSSDEHPELVARRLQEHPECVIGIDTWTTSWNATRKQSCCTLWAKDNQSGGWQVQAGDKVFCCLHFGQGCPAIMATGGAATTTTTLVRPPLTVRIPDGPQDGWCETVWEAFKGYNRERQRSCCEGWKDEEHLADVAVSRPKTAATCCAIMGERCPQVLQELLSTATRTTSTSSAMPPSPAEPGRTDEAIARSSSVDGPPRSGTTAPQTTTTTTAVTTLPSAERLAAPTTAPTHAPSHVPRPSAVGGVVVDLGERSKAASVWLALTALALPVGLLVSTVLLEELRLWTKCCLCCAMLGLAEGILAWSTAVPGSMGWEGCHEYLGDEGLAYFRTQQGSNAFVDFFAMVWEFLHLEVLGVWYEGSKHHLRFCNDMALSGRSFLPVVFSLGLYELCWLRTERLDEFNRQAVRGVMGTGLFTLVFSNVAILLAGSFRYAPDVILAISFSLLLFTNPVVVVASHRWVAFCRGDAAMAPEGEKGGVDDARNGGTTLVPPCCLPLCCFQGRYVIQGHEAYEGHFLDLIKQLRECSEEARKHEVRWREAETMLDGVRGDLTQVHRLRQADQEHLTSMCLEERRKRVEYEQMLEHTKRESSEQLDLHKRQLEQERWARREAEAKKENAATQLAQMVEIPEQPRWSTPIREALLGPPVQATQEAWV